MNNINKLALVALSLFLAVGVCACGSEKDPNKKGEDKTEVKLAMTKTLSKSFEKTNGDFDDAAVTFEVDVELVKGEITEELAKKVKVDAPGFKENGETLDKVGITKLESGKGKITLHFYAGKETVGEFNTLIGASLPPASQADIITAVNAAGANFNGGNNGQNALAKAASERKKLNKDYAIKLSGDIKANEDTKLNVSLTPTTA